MKGRKGALAILTGMAVLGVTVSPVQADPSPRTQTEYADFISGATDNTVVTDYDGGAVQPVQVGDQWRVDTESQWDDWQSASNVATPGTYLTLERYWAWRDTIATDNDEVSTGYSTWTSVKSLVVDVTDADTLRIRVDLRRHTWDDGTAHLRVLVNGVQAHAYDTTSSNYVPHEFTYNVADLTDEVPVTLQLRRSGGLNCRAHNRLLEIDIHRLNYETNGWAIHQYDAGHQVDWLSCSQESAGPDGTSVSVAYRTSDDEGVRADAYNVTTVSSGHELAVSKSAPATVAAGEGLTYTIRYTVTGNAPAPNAFITDVVPADTTYAGCQPASTCFETGGVVTWLLDTLTPGDSGAVWLTVNVAEPLDSGTPVVNIARLSDEAGGQAEDSATTLVISAPDLHGSVKEVDRASAAPGAPLTYTITLTNSGNMNAASVTMTDTLPGEVDFISGPVVIGGGAATYDPAERRVVWSGPVNVGQPVTILYSVRLDEGLAGGTLVENTATVDDGHSDRFEIGPARTRIGRELEIGLSDRRNTVAPGEKITYTIAFSGTEPLNEGRVWIDIPANTAFVAASPDYTLNGTEVSWNLDPQPPGFYGERHLVVRLDPVLDNGTVVSTTATVSGGGRSAEATASAEVISAPNWEASTKTANRINIEPEVPFSYTIRLANTGDMHAPIVRLTDTLPSEVTYVTGTLTATGGAASYDSVTRRILWNGGVDVGQGVWITFAVTLNPDVPPGTVVRNVAYVDDGVSEPTELSSAPMIVQEALIIYLPIVARNFGGLPLPDLAVTEIRVTPTNPVVGETVDIAVAIANRGTQATDACFWIDLYINPKRLPIGVNEGWYEAESDGGLVWSLCGLNVGESVTLHLGDEHYWPEYSYFPGSHFGEPGTYTLYAQVDSWNPETDYGIVYESDEQNVYGPHHVMVVSGEGAASARGEPVRTRPPTRPDALPFR
ncbi:MAG TPA: DUF11 domain-containing protein [Anaerolineae bacterium]|nr:DUF11 domain-containing protein [Anaerolineae bacterium]